MVAEPLLRTLRDIADFLGNRRIEFALIGGLAATVRGEPRATLDVDLVIDCDVPRALTLVDDLTESQFKPLFDGIAEVVEKAFLLPLRHRQSLVKVDLALALTGFERNSIRRATSVKFVDQSVPVISAEDLVLMKVLAGRPRDKEDVAQVVLRQSDSFDWKYVFGIAEALEEAIAEDLVSQLQKLRNPHTG